ncbi:hypothetical protein TNCV_1250801 [Trichonephila clavipes]|nr:hypothetical protein TNCV_1250801 [Trichonephila clavipes]
MREKDGNCLVASPDYMVDALKLPSQAPRVSGETIQTWGPGVVLMEHITSSVGQLLASNSPVVDSRDLNLVFDHTEVPHNKLFVSSPTKYTVELSWPLVLVWPPFELLHHVLTTIVFTQYCRM